MTDISCSLPLWRHKKSCKTSNFPHSDSDEEIPSNSKISSVTPMDQTNCYCIFKIDDQLFGVAVSRVEKIIRAAAVISLPDGPDTIVGLLNVEGRLIPVVNIRKKWHLPERGLEVDDRIIIFKAGALVSFIVNGVEGVVQFDHLAFHQASEIHPGLEHYIEGVGRFHNNSVIIIDMARFFNDQEFSYMEKITADHG